MKRIITGADLKHIGYEEGKIMGTALKIADNQLDHFTKEEIVAILTKVIEYPENCLDDEILEPLAKLMIEEAKAIKEDTIPLKETAGEYAVYGTDYIEDGAKSQMNVAMRLPVTVAGALMPDAHQGYGLPIGGVLATKNAIIPYGVGVDIGCRMALSVFDIPFDHFLANESQYKRELIAHTKFGAGHGFKGREKSDHAVLEDPNFKMSKFIAGLHDKAAAQLGSSGGGNHFVEWGMIEVEKDDEGTGLKTGKYLALLTHSGSRGFGATVAGHYTRLAKELCRLPREAVNLAYLDLDSEAGQEYWLAMNLAGDYASACHEIIHNKLTKAIGANVIAKIENHHNFAWKEKWNGEDVLVHRKGATPAAKGMMGIIPGSMTAPGFLVRGKGESNSINSASHGAGRQMSRTKAIQSITAQEMKAMLNDHNVMLIGGGRDEAPLAYKDINKVMSLQTELVDVVAKFTPKMVRMADDGSRED
ncbi:MAG: RtcB family protein [Flavitalea sp.]